MPRVLDEIDRLPSNEHEPFAAMLVRIEVAEGVLVSGYCYFAQLLVGESECKRGGDASNCATERDGSERKRYVVGIYEKSWENVLDIVFGDNVDTISCRHIGK